VRQEYAFSQRRACGLTVAASSYRYQSRCSDEGLRLMELAREKPGSDIGAPLSRGTTAAIEAASIATQPQPQSQSRTEKHFQGRGHHRRHHPSRFT
jgi:hypothetical protein